MPRLIVILVTLCTLFAFAACSEQTAATDATSAAPAEALVGTWTLADQDGRYQFDPDGSGRMVRGEIDMTFTYTTEGDLISMTLSPTDDMPAREVEMHYAIAQDGTLELWTANAPERMRFQRQ